MRIGVVGNRRYRELTGVLGRLGDYATQHGHTLVSEPDLEQHWHSPVDRWGTADPTLDLVLSCGGDGTLLRAVRHLQGREVPILGINLGQIGFLTSVVPGDFEGAIDAFGRGEHRIERRFTIQGAIVPSAAIRRPGEHAVNDIVIHKAEAVRIIRVRVSVDGEEVGQFTADGMIVATPTGSTAYSLSAGGPVLLPDVEAMVVTAISPHTLRVRPIVVPGSAHVTLEVGGRGRDGALVSFDGQLVGPIEKGDRVEVRRGDFSVLLVRLGEEGFFSRMQRKLEWGDLSDRELMFRAD